MKYLKSFNESDENNLHLYDKEDIEECNSVMLDIKDLTYDLIDLDYEVSIDYSSNTYTKYHAKLFNPEIIVSIFGYNSLFTTENRRILSKTILSIDDFVSKLGFSLIVNLRDSYNHNGSGIDGMIYELKIKK
jgi:hypothetical protein